MGITYANLYTPLQDFYTAVRDVTHIMTTAVLQQSDAGLIIVERKMSTI